MQRAVEMQSTSVSQDSLCLLLILLGLSLSKKFPGLLAGHSFSIKERMLHGAKQLLATQELQDASRGEGGRRSGRIL